MEREAWIVAGGVFHVVLVVFHLFFWKLFHWRSELAKLTSLNRAVVQVLNLCLTFVFGVVACLSFLYSGDLVSSVLGRSVVLAIAGFWYLRAVFQLVFFSVKSVVSIGLLLLFVVGGVLYTAPLLG